MKVTIKDLARMAGVSTATVSMVLNNKANHISEKTKEKIWDLAKTHNYVPNILARSLVTKKTRTIGLVIPDITNPFFPEISRGAEDRANEGGYSVIICNSDDSPVKEERYVKMLMEKMVDGIIFTDSSSRTPLLLETRSKGVPVVLMGRDVEVEGPIGRIFVDNIKGAYDATNHLIERGYKKIALLNGNSGYQTAQERMEGYRRALQDAGLPYAEQRVLEGTFRQEWGYGGVSWLINQGISFDAVVCGNDMVAIGAIKALRFLGKRVPEDVAIIGYDDIYMAKLVDPELTTIAQPSYDLGYNGCDILIRMIEDGYVQQDPLCYEGQLVVRKST